MSGSVNDQHARQSPDVETQRASLGGERSEVEVLDRTPFSADEIAHSRDCEGSCRACQSAMRKADRERGWKA